MATVHVSCISLVRRPDRRRAIRDRVKPHLPNLTFFNAIDKEEPSAIAAVDESILPRVRVMPRAKRGAREAKAACIASHVALLRRCIKRNSFPHIVLEDDIAVANNEWGVKLPASFPTDGICLLGGLLNAVRVADMKAFHANGTADRIASRFKHGINEIDKRAYRVSSTAAYYVPNVSVANDFLSDLSRRKSLTHLDIEMHKSPSVAYLLFPSPFVSNIETAAQSDIITSQSMLFSSRYTRLPKRSIDPGIAPIVRRSSDAPFDIGRQPIVVITHVYRPAAHDQWRRVKWPHGRIVMLCDCDSDTAVKYVCDNLVVVTANREDTKRGLVHSIDKKTLAFKGFDTSILFASRQNVECAWFVEGDVAFDADAMSSMLTRHARRPDDLIGTGDSSRSDAWTYNRTMCRYACELRVGTLVSICRCSRRLLQEVVRLARKGTVCYIEKLLPSICVVKKWSFFQLKKGVDVDRRYSISPKKSSICRTARLPLHACK